MHQPSQQQLLVKLFLLALENDRLTLQIQQDYREQTNVMKRIDEIQNGINEDLKAREQKIHDLNKHVREMHALNQQITNSLQTAKAKYRNLEQAYISQVASYKHKLQRAQIRVSQETRPCPGCQQSRVRQQLWQKQKQHLIWQKNRLQQITIKQLEQNIRSLTKQNQSYILSIGNYRTELSNHQLEKDRMQEKLGKVGQKVEELVKERDGLEEELEKVRGEIQRYKGEVVAKMGDMGREHSMEIDRLMANHEKYVNEVSSRNNYRDNQLSTAKELLKKQCQDLDRKSKKLRQYDDKYTYYVHKMTSTTNQLSQQKQQNRKLTQKLAQGDNKLKAAQEKYTKQMSRVMGEMEKKIGIRVEEERRVNRENIRVLEEEIGMLRGQGEKLVRDWETQRGQIEKLRDEAVAQWQDIVKQMQIQKQIISSLQKQVQSYKTSAREQLTKRKENQVSSQLKNQFAIPLNLPLGGPLENPLDQLQQKIQERSSIYKMSQTPQAQSSRTHISQTEQLSSKYELISKLCSVGTIQKNIVKNKDIRRDGDDCQGHTHGCQDCKSSKQSTSRQLRQGDCIPFRINNQRERVEDGLLGLSEKLPMSYKRRDDKFKKYQLERSKTEVFDKQKDYGPLVAKQAPFFDKISIGSKYTPRCPPPSDVYNAHAHQHRTERIQSLGRQENSRPIQYMSLQKVEKHRNNIEEIQSYLSFDLNALKMGHSSSEQKLPLQKNNSVETIQGHSQPLGISNRGLQKSVLQQKIGNVTLLRDNTAYLKQAKFYNFCKKPMQQGSIPRRPERSSNKENINDIIQRKSQFLHQP